MIGNQRSTTRPSFSGEAPTINGHPQYILMVLAVLLVASPYVGHLHFFHEWLWDTTGRSQAEWIVTALAVPVLLWGGLHSRLVFDSTTREIRKVRQFLWMPLYSTAWPFSELRCIRLSFREESSRFAGRGFRRRRSLASDLLLGGEGAGSGSHYELHAVLKDRRTIFIRYSGQRKPLADLGIQLARVTGTRLG